ncbi:hypothetical protein ACLOJK_015269 [Asimina triloba]
MVEGAVSELRSVLNVTRAEFDEARDNAEGVSLAQPQRRLAICIYRSSVPRLPSNVFLTKLLSELGIMRDEQDEVIDSVAASREEVFRFSTELVALKSEAKDLHALGSNLDISGEMSHANLEAVRGEMSVLQERFIVLALREAELLVESEVIRAEATWLLTELETSRVDLERQPVTITGGEVEKMVVDNNLLECTDASFSPSFGILEEAPGGWGSDCFMMASLPKRRLAMLGGEFEVKVVSGQHDLKAVEYYSDEDDIVGRGDIDNEEVMPELDCKGNDALEMTVELRESASTRWTKMLLNKAKMMRESWGCWMFPASVKIVLSGWGSESPTSNPGRRGRELVSGFSPSLDGNIFVEVALSDLFLDEVSKLSAILRGVT